MAKPLFQDIVPPDKRSIKRVPIPERSPRSLRKPGSEDSGPVRRLEVPDDENPGRARMPDVTVTAPVAARKPVRVPPPPQTPSYVPTSTVSSVSEERAPLNRVPFYEERDPYRRRFPWKSLIVLVCAIVIVGAAYFILSRYAKATVTVTPKTASVTVNGNQFIGTQISSTTGNTVLPGQIQYEVISATKDGAMTVASTGQSVIQTKATGTITIFNNYSTTAQKLVANTRFATPSGLIYRIGSAVSVPGKKGTTPGSITVTITADQPGSQYNVGLSDFVIPGFSGTSMYNNIYGRSQTAMTGGASGTEPKIDPATLAAAQATIDAELESSLISQAKQNTPGAEIILPDAYTISYSHQDPTIASTTPAGQAVVHEEGTISAIALNISSLASQLALVGTSSASLPSSIPWQIPDTSGLSFSMNSSGNSAGNPSLTFNLTGTATLVATIDQTAIQENLAGKPKSDFDPILSGFPAVSTASMTIEPFWQTHFPTNQNSITIVLSPAK